jgi:malate synthase
MAAQIPIKGDEKANTAAMDKVKADKLREVKAGHDGTWVAHPMLAQIALDIFNEHMKGPNQVRRPPPAALSKRPGSVPAQYHIRREEVQVSQLDLLNTNVNGAITEGGVRANCSAALQYVANWVGGVGCVPINVRLFVCRLFCAHLIAPLHSGSWRTPRRPRLPARSSGSGRASPLHMPLGACSSLSAHSRHGATTKDGKKVSADYIDGILAEEATKAAKTIPASQVDYAKRYMSSQVHAPVLSDFLTSDLMSSLSESEKSPAAKL